MTSRLVIAMSVMDIFCPLPFRGGQSHVRTKNKNPSLKGEVAHEV
jgi:hypothetical protein